MMSSSSLQQQLDFKHKQLEQARRKRKILEQEIVGTKAEAELLTKRVKDLASENERLDLQLHSLQQERDRYESVEFKTWWNEVQTLLQDSDRESLQHKQELVDDLGEENISSMNINVAISKALNQLNHILKSNNNIHQHISTLHQSSAVTSLSSSSLSPTPRNDSFSNSAPNSSSFSSSFSSFQRYYAPLLKETSHLLQEAQTLFQTTQQIQSGPLAHLEERHRQLQSAIDDTKRKMHIVSLHAEKEERSSLIKRYKSEIPLLKQELASRPRAGKELQETKQRMIDQVQTLASELNQVMEDLQVFEKRDEMENELSALIEEMAEKGEIVINAASNASPFDAAENILETLKVEVGTLQEQLDGLLEFSVVQRETISQWNSTEFPRHRDFIAHLEQERDQLVEELQSMRLEVPKLKSYDDNGEDDKKQSEEQADRDDDGNEQSCVNNDDSVIVSDDANAASPTTSTTRLVQIVHFDPQQGASSTVETIKAPTKRWQRSAKFIDDNNSVVLGRYNLNNQINNNNNDGQSKYDVSEETSFMMQTFRWLASISAPPLVEFIEKENASFSPGSNNGDSSVDSALNHHQQPTSLTVRVLSRLSSWMFGEMSFVERGRKERKTKQIGLDASSGPIVAKTGEQTV